MLQNAPLEYFKMLFDDEIMSTIVAQKYLYRTQKTGKCVNTNANEMYKNIGIHILIGIVKLYTYTLYWSNNFKYSPIAYAMPLKRFEPTCCWQYNQRRI